MTNSKIVYNKSSTLQYVDIYTHCVYNCFRGGQSSGDVKKYAYEASMTISTSENFIGFSLSGIPIGTLWLCMGTVFLVTVVDWLMGDYWPKLERG